MRLEFSIFGPLSVSSKGVLGKGGGKNKSTSEMRQNQCFIGKRGTFQTASEMRRNASEMRQKCAEHLDGGK